MTRVTTYLKTIGASILASTSIFAQQMPDQSSELAKKAEDCYISGIKKKATCYTFQVPLDYQEPSGVQIDLHVTILKPTGSLTKQDPFFIYAGGPGQAAGEYGNLVKLAFHKINEERPIILMDQRGTGKSSPMRCRMEGYLPEEGATEEFIKKCFEEQPNDVRHFDSLSVVHDTEFVRKEFGFEALNFWGGSFGTRLSAYYALTYPDKVRSMILDGVLPPDQSLFYTAPFSAERAINKLIEKCQAEKECNMSFPSLREDIQILLDRAKKGEVLFKGPDPVTAEPIEFSLSRDMMVEAIRSNLYAAETTQYLPVMIKNAVDGDFNGLLAALLNGTGVSDSMYLGSTLSILCSEEVPTVTAESVKQHSAGTFAEDSYYTYWSTACKNWQAKPFHQPFKNPLKTDIPTLVLSGDLDPVTPPTLGDILMKGLSNARHIIVKGTGHNTSHIGCMPSLMAEFVNDLKPRELDSGCLRDYKAAPAFTAFSGTTKKQTKE
ncbi:alpha/beta hydrolase [Temperatibacter marinus]|uniref:Proline iminopeptidase n=1 Tax=Temperatibacter marinus TaxID=1456591 RepID=A0AA52EEC5_9PROT|nr:alpha/beta hydrolase [Temperatibacter marinus]WND02113.1 alpha/beta hydrolase [Temperatibacter marinus]